MARSAAPRSTTNSAGRTLLRLFPDLRTAVQWRQRRSWSRLPQADHGGGRAWAPSATSTVDKQRVAGGHAADRSSAAPACGSASAAARLRAWAAAATSAELDFASVQRANPEMERRCAGSDRRLLARSARTTRSCRSTTSAPAACPTRCPSWPTAPAGARGSSWRRYRCVEPQHVAAEIWCNESQERYVLARRARSAAAFCLALRTRALPVRRGRHGRPTMSSLRLDGPAAMLARSTCPWTCCSARRRGCSATGRTRDRTRAASASDCDLSALDLDAVVAVLRLPAVASKSFLISIGDRTVGGLTARDQMVGPWQVPVADCAVGLLGLSRPCGRRGRARASDRRSPSSIRPPRRAWRSPRH